MEAAWLTRVAGINWKQTVFSWNVHECGSHDLVMSGGISSEVCGLLNK